MHLFRTIKYNLILKCLKTNAKLLCRFWDSQKENTTFRGLDPLGRSSSFFARGDFCGFLFAFVHTPFEKGSILKGKKKLGENSFHFNQIPLQKGDNKKKIQSCLSSKCIHSPLMLNESVSINLNTVEPRYLELAYFELPFISKWKSSPCFNMKLWQQVTK